MNAMEWAASVEPNGAHNGPQDALRHAIRNALLTKTIGADRAKVWTDAHEESSADPDETRMDLFNNAVGRQVGQTWSDVYEGVLWAREQGMLCLYKGAC